MVFDQARVVDGRIVGHWGACAIDCELTVPVQPVPRHSHSTATVLCRDGASTGMREDPRLDNVPTPSSRGLCHGLHMGKTSLHIGAAGELLVQFRLVRNGIDSVRRTTDSGWISWPIRPVLNGR